MVGLADQEKIGGEFVHVAKDEKPLTPRNLLHTPLSEWKDTVEHSKPPHNLDQFERNLRNSAGQEIKNALHNIEQQFKRLENGVDPTRLKTEPPKNASDGVKLLYKAAFPDGQVNKDNHDPEKLEQLGEDIKQKYGEKIDEVMEKLRTPPEEVKPEQAPQEPAQDKAPVVKTFDA